MVENRSTVSPSDSQESRMTVRSQRTRSIIREFSLNTSTHGIPGIARSESKHNRIFWSISLLIFTGAMTYFIVQAILAYFAYPTQTSISITHEWPQAFPAVTICNYAPLIYDRFIESFLNYTNSLQLTNTSDTTNFTIEQASYIQDYLTYKLNRNESLQDFFYPLDSMLISCSYNRLTCTAANFTWFISPSYGLCYTFNAKLKDSFGDTLKYNADNGENGKLELHLYIHQHQYVPYLSNGVGAVILVHDNQQLPFIEMVGMLLAPSRHHKLGYQKKTSYFLPAPYTTCSDQLTLGMQAMFNEYHDTDYGYLELACFAACIQSYTYQKCKCGNPFRWTARFIVLPGHSETINIPLCNVSDPCYKLAATEIMNTVSIWTTYCPTCKQECEFTEFIIKPTSVLAPPTYLLKNIKQFVESSQVPLPMNWSTSWISEIALSYVSVEVTYETTRSELYSQQASISAVDVISNVGGNTGLWIGISFLSLMELAEMIYRLARVQWFKLQTVMQRNKQ
ncbi:unnamed protein product [Adineta ricciae]|uniref:Uncharacterized protein n=1 Tax=Adineta ricciae TaxID=249248 RepID=A0A816B3G9_ADIRI|nr:unnamed protein product [Adineta ricciae]